MIRPSPELTPQQFDSFRELIERRFGIYCSDSRREVLRRALAARMTRRGAATWDHYHHTLSSADGDDELRELLRCITVSETAFFRIPSQFEALRSVLVPAIIGERRSGTLNIWSAGCASGEEPYSIAIALAEMEAALRGWKVHILATDVSADAIERARRGVYHERAVRGVPRGYLARYFECRPDGYEVGPELRSRVVFEEFNLADPSYPRPQPDGWDLIFCRNVTIYFRTETTRQVVARFRETLRPGGFLVLGPTECLHAICDDFETVEASGALVYAKPPLAPPLARMRRTCGELHPPAPAPTAGPRVERVEPVSVRPAPRAAPSPRAAEEDACARALAAVAEDRWQRAEKILVPLVGESSSARPRLLLAWLRALRGEREQATALCLELLARDPLLGPAHYILGLVATRAGDLEESAEHLGKAIYADSGLVPAYYYLGVAQCARGDLLAARRCFRGALRVLDQGGDAWLDFAEGLTPQQWRRACEQRLAVPATPSGT